MDENERAKLLIEQASLIIQRSIQAAVLMLGQARDLAHIQALDARKRELESRDDHLEPVG